MLIPCKARKYINNEKTYVTDYVNVTWAGEYTPHRNYTVTSKRGKSKDKTEYIEQFGTFDIETTTLTYTDECGELKPLCAYMYVWQMCIDGDVIVGRSWEEFFDVLRKIHVYYRTGAARLFCIYVHNLPFEYSFMAGYFGEYKNLFATDRHKTLRDTLDELGIQFRCSFKLTNMSLVSFTNEIPGCIHVKAKDTKNVEGDLDYSLIRHCQTELTPTEWGYCVNDVLGLWEALSYKFRMDGTNMSEVPYTSTSYTRRDVNKAVRKYCKNLLKTMALNDHMYELTKEAMRGGDTHANKYKAGRIYNNVYSYDASSMYPAMMLLFDYPSTAWRKPIPQDDMQTYLETSGKGFIARVKLSNVAMKDTCFNPYLSISKCRNIKGGDFDNGRVWSADELETTIYSPDYRILQNCYDYDIDFLEVYICDLAPIPKAIRDVILSYFIAKTELKIAKKRTLAGSAERFEAEYNLLIAKQKLNSIYGMAATDPVHELLLYNGEEWIDFDYDLYHTDDDYKKKIDKIGVEIPEKKSIHDITAENATLPMQWGGWTTALAREHLRRILDCAGDSYIYCDTDSCKATDFDLDKVKALNEWVYKLCNERGAYCVVDGKKHYLGFFDNETNIHDEEYAPTYARFITLGAKRYAFDEYTETINETEFGCTISGVNKFRGAEYIKSVDNFKVGLYIPNSGGFMVTYNDSIIEQTITITDYKGVRGTAKYKGYTALLPRNYTLTLTDEQLRNYRIVEQINT